MSLSCNLPPPDMLNLLCVSTSQCHAMHLQSHVVDQEPDWLVHCRYAQGKFETAFGTTLETSLEQLSSRLTHTRAWLALVSGQVPQLAQHLQPLADFAADHNRIQAAANAATTSAGTYS